MPHQAIAVAIDEYSTYDTESLTAEHAAVSEYLHGTRRDLRALLIATGSPEGQKVRFSDKPGGILALQMALLGSEQYGDNPGLWETKLRLDIAAAILELRRDSPSGAAVR